MTNKLVRFATRKLQYWSKFNIDNYGDVDLRFCKLTLEERGKYTTRIRARSIYDGRNIYVSWTFYSEINTYSYTDGKRVYYREIIYFFISRWSLWHYNWYTCIYKPKLWRNLYYKCCYKLYVAEWTCFRKWRIYNTKTWPSLISMVTHTFQLNTTMAHKS